MNALILLSVLAILGMPARAGVYGSDHRKEVYQTTDPGLRSIADSEVAIFLQTQALPDPTGQRIVFKSNPYGEDKYLHLCKDERFYGEPSASYCSGMLVGPDLVLTAGHCMSNESECKDKRYVFGWEETAAGQAPASVPASEVYTCRALVGREDDVNKLGADWALVRLDRPVPNHQPQPIERSSPPKSGVPLFIVGNPSGLPIKIADGGVVRRDTKDGYFVADIDAFGGNSGSSVFDARTNAIVGVLARQDYTPVKGPDHSADFTFDAKAGCYRVNVCPYGVCEGEDITNIAPAAKLIPAPANPAAFNATKINAKSAQRSVNWAAGQTQMLSQ